MFNPCMFSSAAGKGPGMIADELCDYLYARSSGYIGSPMTLINRGCRRAVRSGEEKLNTELLDKVKIDAASEKGRQELGDQYGQDRYAEKWDDELRPRGNGRGYSSLNPADTHRTYRL